MVWAPFTVFDVDGLTPEQRANLDTTGFIQWADLPAAQYWTDEAVRLSSLEAENALRLSPWTAQLAGVHAPWLALEKVYRALNIRWQYDPPNTDAWTDAYGGWFPDAPVCKVITGPDGFFGYGAMLEHITDMWEAVKGPLPTTVYPIYAPSDDLQVRAWQRANSLHAEGGGRDPGPFPAVTPIGTRTVRNGNFEVVVPAFLTYASMSSVRDTANPTVFGLPSESFDGVWTGAACESATSLAARRLAVAQGMPEPAVVYVEVPAGTDQWSWDCWRWDDAPLNRVRVQPPLRWSMEVARTIAQSLAARGPAQVIRDTRVRAILENLARAQKYGTDQEGLSESVVTTVESLTSSRHVAAKDMALFDALSGAVCGTAGTANPLAGLACTGVKLAADAFLGLVPLAVGCDLDAWGQPMPSAVEPRISRDVPPKWTVDIPIGVALLPVADLLLPPLLVKPAAMGDNAPRTVNLVAPVLMPDMPPPAPIPITVLGPAVRPPPPPPVAPPPPFKPGPPAETAPAKGAQGISGGTSTPAQTNTPAVNSTPPAVVAPKKKSGGTIALMIGALLALAATLGGK